MKNFLGKEQAILLYDFGRLPVDFFDEIYHTLKRTHLNSYTARLPTSWPKPGYLPKD